MGSRRRRPRSGCGRRPSDKTAWKSLLAQCDVPRPYASRPDACAPRGSKPKAAEFECYLPTASMKVAPGIDDDRLAGHRLGAAHRDHHGGAVVLVGGLFQKRRGRGALDKLGPEIGWRPRALQQAR